jgi:ferredoxin-NADP reductase
LVGETRAGDQFELRGPVGGYFVWHSGLPGPLLLVGGGSGLVPLMAMLRHRRASSSDVDARLLLSARTFEDLFYREELEAPSDAAVHITLTRGSAPPGWTGFTGRIDRDMLTTVGPQPGRHPHVYVCGPTSFVEEAARLLVELGHEPSAVHTERFGPTGG